MKKQKLNQSGIAHVLLFVLLAIVIGVVGYSAFRVYESKQSNVTSENAQQKAEESPVKIKSLGINLDYYDPTTNKAGDLEFTKFKFPEGTQQTIFDEYGTIGPANSAKNYQALPQPQPTFLVPKGTKVRSLVDGTVINIPKLYSNDYSVHVQGKGSDLIFETEHVIDVQVKVGDQVKAGQVIATASDYNGDKLGGLALFEIGVLKGGKTPTHLCPSDYFDASVKEDFLNKITAFKKAWSDYRGEPNAYPNNSVIPGCVNREPITDNNNSATGKQNN
jgi:biotin carboxyl carrier protein